MDAINYIRGSPDDLKTKVALHMMQQCIAHRRGEPTQPYTLDEDVTPGEIRMLGNEGWLVMGPPVLSWSRRKTVHKPGYC